MNQTFDPVILLDLIEKRQVFVAEDENAVTVGFIIISEKSSCAYIEEIDVLRAYGNRGIGKSLLEQSFAWARENGFKKMLLRTASNVPWNAPMYARFGFTTIAPSNWNASMSAIDANEESKGLPVADRVFMELIL